jgi:hypothetical protein
MAASDVARCLRRAAHAVHGRVADQRTPPEGPSVSSQQILPHQPDGGLVRDAWAVMVQEVAPEGHRRQQASSFFLNFSGFFPIA